jgi:hypothetical protein
LSPIILRIMRIWDIPPERLCRQHLLGEHRELHALWVILTQGKQGFARHPETARWRGKLKALYQRHQALVTEMGRRGYRHATPLPAAEATGAATQEAYKDTPEEQVRILRSKGCGCRV